MGWLDGDLQPIVSGAFGWVLLDGTLHRRTLMEDGLGGYVEGAETETPVKGMIDRASQVMRDREDFRDTDVQILILAEGIGNVTLDNEITLRGGRYHILPPLDLDAAMTHWTMRGRLK
jgi:hypothetical protein